MTQEEKDLIFKDLCGRLSYGVKLRNTRMEDPTDIGSIVRLYSINLDEYYCKIAFYTYEGKALCVSNEDKLFKVGNRDVDFLRYKPYLFPLSSMTDEQKKELHSLMTQDSYGILYHTIESYDYLNKNLFDFRGLIERGFAIDCTNLNIY
jgi:hypothetical protein